MDDRLYQKLAQYIPEGPLRFPVLCLLILFIFIGSGAMWRLGERLTDWFFAPAPAGLIAKFRGALPILRTLVWGVAIVITAIIFSYALRHLISTAPSSTGPP